VGEEEAAEGAEEGEGGDKKIIIYLQDGDAARGLEVPNTHLLVLSARSDKPSVGRDSNRKHRRLVTREEADTIAGGDIPHANRLIGRTREDVVAVGMEANTLERMKGRRG